MMSDASGIFPPSPGRHGPPRTALKASRAKWLLERRVFWNADLDATLMDHIADGLSFKRTADAMGLNENAVSGRFAALRRKMGWQAT